MPSFCGVVGCGNRADRDRKSFYRLPAVLNKGGDQIVEASKRRRRLWINSLKRADLTETKLKYLRICEDHFISGAPAAMEDTNNPDWIPNINVDYSSPSLTNTQMQRFERAKKRRIVDPTVSSASDQKLRDSDGSSSDSCEVDCDVSDITRDTDKKSVEVQTDLTVDDIDKLTNVNRDYLSKIKDLESTVNKLTISEKTFENDDTRTLYYTGIPNFQALTVISNITAPFFFEKSALSKFQQLILTLMRLRLRLSFTDLAYRFSVSRSTVSRVYQECLYVLYQRLKKLIKWRGREELRMSMPQTFRLHFGNRVAVIIDCFEVFIERPSNLRACAESWSNYKSHNTVKFLIGIALQGVITFISEAWGGRVSDKFLIEQSELLENLLPGDVVLADRGFTISDAVGLYYAEVKIPAFTKEKKQLSAQGVEITRKIAHVRIHVERVTGTLRQKFKILKSTVPITMPVNRSADRPATIDQIVTVCCALTNLCPSVIPMDSE